MKTKRHALENGSEKRKRLVAALAGGATHGLACQYAGIAPSTFYAMMAAARKGDPEWASLLEEVDEAEARAAIGALGVIRAAATQGTWQAAAWLLERRFGYTIR